MRKLFISFLILLGLLSVAAPVLACETPPPAGSTTCADLGSGYSYGFKISGSRSGVYHFTSDRGTLVGGAPQDKINFVKIFNSNGRSFDWSASLGIDAVIINAGSKSNVVKLNEKKDGDNFHGTADYRGRLSTIDKIYFCYDYELSASTTAQGTSSTSTAWEITKNAATVEQSKFAGETATFDYTVAVKKTAGSDSGSVVSSVVKIKNNTPLKAYVVSVKDYLNPDRVPVTLDCGKYHFPTYLYPGAEIACTASTPVSGKINGDNFVYVRTYGNVGGASATGHIQWSGSGTGTPGSSKATVTDTNAAFGGPYTVENDQTWTYPVSLSCPSDPAAYTDGETTVTLKNTAAITETDQQASEDVTLHCYAPVVTASGSPTYDEQYFWNITKTSTVTNLTLKKEETATVPYEVKVDVAKSIKTNLQVTGAVTVANPNPDAPMTVTLADEIAPGVPATLIDCTNPVTIPADSSVTCNYQNPVDGEAAGTNVANVTFNNIVFNATAAYDFANAQVAKKIDACVNVTDDALSAPLGTVCTDAAPANFTYNLQLGPYLNASCNSKSTYVNTASFVTNDTQTSGLANWKVNLTIKCQSGNNCTYTPVYWASHADPSNTATYNTTWDKVTPSGPSSPFFGTGSTWIEMLQTDPGESAYRQLAQSYITADLNVKYGANASPAFLTKLDHAASLLNQYGAAQDTIGEDVVPDFLDTADQMNNFNNGLTGPGICPDCEQ